MTDDIKRGTIYSDEIKIGMSRSLRKVVSDQDIQMFAQVSTDRNPVHLDDEYAAQTMFKGRIAHGMLTAGLISAVIGEQLPGHGSIYMGQTLKFLGPVRPGDEVFVEVTVSEFDAARRRVTLDCKCSVGDTIVLTGEAKILAPRRT